jgi:hypothetical protein
MILDDELDALDRAAAWRLRQVDAAPGDTGSAQAARLLEALAADLRANDHTALWTELRSIGHWLGESDALSDYAELAVEYRARIGVSEHPEDGAAYLRALLQIARDLI